MATKSGNHHRKIWTAQKCRGVEEKGKVSEAISARMCSQL